MARIRIPLTSFDYGEVSPSLTSRTDAAVYTHAAAKVRNLFIKSEGGVEKRSGTKNWYQFSHSYNSSLDGLQIRLEPFIFSDDERYIFAFSDAQLDIFILDPTNNYEPDHIQTLTQDVNGDPILWDQGDVIELTMANQADVMFICHPYYPIMKLVRTSLTTFELDYFEFAQSADGNKVYQPYNAFQGVGVTISASATSGTGVTLTSSANYFTADHVGTRLLVNDTECLITGYTSATQVTATIKGNLRVQLDIDALETVEGSTTVLVTHALHGLSNGASITIDRAAGIASIPASDINGTKTITYKDQNTYEITVATSATSSAVGGGSPRVETGAATTEWKEQSYSSLRGYPSAVTFHEGRLWFAGSLAQPSHVWGSHSNDYFNFSLGDGEDGEGISLSASTGSFDQIRHLMSNRDLQVFASDSEFYVPSFDTEPIKPSTAQIRRQTPFGSSFVKPLSFDGATLFVQKTGSVVREYVYSDAEGSYVASDISQLSPHLIRTPVQQAMIKGALNKPESYAFYINNDGTMSVFYSVRADKKAGWALWDTEGKFHSVCSIGERLFTCAVRDDGSGTNKFYLEEFQSDMPMDNCKLYTGTAGVFDVSADFQDGAIVKAVNGTDYLGTYEVGDTVTGEIDASPVDATVTSAYIGRAFTPQLQTLPVDGTLSTGPLTGTQRRITSVVLDLYSTLSISVDGTDMIIRNVNDDFALGRTPFTGKKEFFVLGFSRDPQVTISQSVPLAMQLNGMVMEVAF